MLRRPILISALILACTPSVPYVPPPSSLNTVVFDLASAEIPQPNDLSLQPAALETLPNNAEKELLTTFQQQGGYPNDQEAPVTIQFQRVNVAKNGQVTLTAPALDISSLTSTTIVALQVSSANVPSPITLDPISASDYVVSGSVGTLTLHNKNRAPWPAGMQIVIGLRGEAHGVTVNLGEEVLPSTNFFLLLSNENLSLPQNTTLLPGGRAQQLQEGQQLENIRLAYQPVYALIDAVAFPHQELAVLTTFKIAPATSAFVETNAVAGEVPLPSDFLLNASGTQVQLIPAFGPLAAGIATLDGFSTTAPITAQTSAPILAQTVTKDTVLFYDLSDPSHPQVVPDATQTSGVYVTQPAEVVQTVQGVAVSNAVVLQPAVPFTGTNGAAFLPPLKENTEYAVVITSGVQDTNQKGLTKSTVSQILLFQQPLVNSAGQSELPGVDNATAQGLERMRLLLKPVVTQVQADKGITESQIAIAYTFLTQTITGKNSINNSSKPPGLLQFAALPYDVIESTAYVPTTPTSLTPDEAFARFGVDTTVVPNGDIAEILETTFPTTNLLSDTTGAFNAATATVETLGAILAIPKTAAVPFCPTGAGFPAGSHCAPLVVFHHGLGGGRGDMLTVANELVKQGFVVAAIDAPKHGDRSWCSADNQCAAGGTCVAIPGASAQGDTVPPGICSKGLVKAPVLCATAACTTAWAASANQDGTALASGNYLVSGNLFRTRDTFRQDVIDNSALILAISRPPGLPAPAQPNPVTSLLAMSGIVIDPSQVFWEGQSLGAILGTLNVASNARIGRAALNVGGGTVVDVITHAPAFTNQVTALLTSLGIQPGTPQYLQFILLAKWVLDPSEPVNFADNLLGNATHPTLPDLLTGMASQTGKPTLGQLAACDTTVPNAFNLELYTLIGLQASSATASTVTLFENTNDAGGACPFGVATTSPGTVPNGFLTDWGVSFSAAGVPSVNMNVAALTLLAQDQNAAFLNNLTLPPPIQTQP
jgi:hypothetical protein